MMFNKSVPSMLSLLLAVAGVALLGFSPMRQAWQINAWSLQSAHRMFIPATEQGTDAFSRDLELWWAKMLGKQAFMDTV